MMADLDRITELLLSEDFGADVPDSLMGRMIPDTEPTLDPNSLEALIANQQAQDDFLMMMAMGPKNISKSAIQRFIPRVEMADFKKLVRKFINPKTGKLEDGLFHAGRPSTHSPERIKNTLESQVRRRYKHPIDVRTYTPTVDEIKTFNPYGGFERNYYMSNPIKEMLMPFQKRVKIVDEIGIDPLSPSGPYKNIDAEAARLLKELMN
jgi:hypothetical protein